MSTKEDKKKDITQFIVDNIETMNIRDISSELGISTTAVSNYIKKLNIEVPEFLNRNRVIDEIQFLDDDIKFKSYIYGSVLFNGNMYSGKKSKYFQFFIPKSNKQQLILLRDLLAIKSKVLEAGSAYSYSLTSIIFNSFLTEYGFPDKVVNTDSKVAVLAGVYSSNKYSNYSFYFKSSRKNKIFDVLFKDYTYNTGKYYVIKEEYREEIDSVINYVESKRVVYTNDKG